MRAIWGLIALIGGCYGAMVGGTVYAEPLAERPVSTEALDRAPALMIIRLNQPHVYFEKTLSRLVKEAVHIQQDVAFDILAISPDEQPPMDVLKDTTEHVRYVLYHAGVAPGRMRVSFMQDKLLTSNEVHVYLRAS